MENQDFLTIINAEEKVKMLDMKELWQYKDLIRLFVKRNIRVQYRQTVFGPLWVFVTPLLTSVVFTIVFGNFAGISTAGIPQMLFYLIGTSLWNLFSTTLNQSAVVFKENQATFGKLYYPRMTVPISYAITCIFNFLIQFIVILGMDVFYFITGETRFTPLLFLFPVILCQIALFGIGVGLIIASAAVKYRDLLLALSFLIQIWMYATPIVYPLSTTGGWMHFILLLNPMTAAVENFRYFMTGQGEMLTGWWAVSWGLTLLCYMLGVYLFKRAERTFIDSI